jgi:NADH-quinone oxidoreductase subunit M
LITDIMIEAEIPILSLLIALPLIAAGSVTFIPQAQFARYFALAIAGLELVLAASLFAVFDYGSGKLQLIERIPWIESLNISYVVGVDGLSVVFPFLTALLTLAIIVTSWTQIQTQIRLYLALLFLLESSTLGVFCALDLALFFLFWELTLVPIFFLTSLWGIGPQRRYAAVKYTLLMLAGGVPLLFGIILLALNHAEQLGIPTPRGLSFDYLTLLHLPIAEEWRTAIFFLLFLGFAVKAPVFPFHTWLPSMTLEGPTALSAWLTGFKLGIYGILRFAMPLVPDVAKQYAWLMGGIGAVGALYGALIALRETNLRRLLAYASLSHVGFVLIGIASLTLQGLQGAFFQLANFALVSSGLFFIAGFLHHRLGSTDLSGLGGAARPMPLMASFFFILGLALIGVPGTNGFAAEHLILIGAFKAHLGTALIALFSVILSAAYFLGFFQRAFLGTVRLEVVRASTDLRPRELLMINILVGLIFLSGFAPHVVTQMSQSSAAAWILRINATPHSSAYAQR